MIRNNIPSALQNRYRHPGSNELALFKQLLYLGHYEYTITLQRQGFTHSCVDPG